MTEFSKTQMFIGNLPWSIRARHLEEDFAQFGTVTDAFVAYKGRRSRGFGFVTMSTPEEAAAALAALDGKKVGEGEHEREQRVIFAKARSDEDQAKADLAKEAATQRRAERVKKQKEGGKGGNSTVAKKEVTEEKKEEPASWDLGAAKAARKAAEMPDHGMSAEELAALRAKAKGNEMTDAQKKERGLLYDTSKASAVRDDDDDEDDEGEADFGGGDPFEGL